MTYRRRASPLHAARAGAGIAFCAGLAGVALVSRHPVVLGAALLAVLLAAAGAGALRDVGRAARFAVPLVLLLALVNPLVDRNGVTVIARLGELPPFGELDVTLEATVTGLVLGLRALVVVLAAALYAVAVDPAEVLRLFRRVSFRSALVGTLATRLVPVLAADGRRMAEAQRARPHGPPARLAVVRAVTAGALDRAQDVAAALELRGFGRGGTPPPRHRPWSRHDLALAAAAVALLGVTAALLGGAAGDTTQYPRLSVALDARTLVLAGLVPLLAALPFLDRRGTG